MFYNCAPPIYTYILNQQRPPLCVWTEYFPHYRIGEKSVAKLNGVFYNIMSACIGCLCSQTCVTRCGWYYPQSVQRTCKRVW